MFLCADYISGLRKCKGGGGVVILIFKVEEVEIGCVKHSTRTRGTPIPHSGWWGTGGVAGMAILLSDSRFKENLTKRIISGIIQTVVKQTD